MIMCDMFSISITTLHRLGTTYKLYFLSSCRIDFQSVLLIFFVVRVQDMHPITKLSNLGMQYSVSL